MARSHVAWSNSTPSLPLLSSSFDQPSICRGISIPVEGQCYNGSLFLSWGLLKRNYSQQIRPASSSCLDQSYRNAPEKSAQNRDSPTGPPSASRAGEPTEEPHFPLQLNPHHPARDLASRTSPQKTRIASLNYDFPYKVHDIPNLKRAPSPIPQRSKPRELLPPIELSDREDPKDSGESATNFFDYACHEYLWPPDNVQRCDFAPAQTNCEGLGIFSDSSESGFPCKDDMQPMGQQSNFGSSIGYLGVTLESAVDRFQIIPPIRRLSYGEHSQTLESKPLHRTVGCRELRHTIGCLTIADDHAPSFHGISSTDRLQHTDECPVPPRSKPRLRIDTFRTSERRQAIKSKSDRMETSSSKPSLWIAPDHDDQIGDAYGSKQAQMEVQVEDVHLAIKSSPSLVTVTHGSSKPSSRTSTPDQPPNPVSAFSPYTPPETPHSLQKQKQNLDVVNDQPSYPITPPSSRLATPRSKDTLERIRIASSNEVFLTNGSSPDIPILSSAFQRTSPTGTSVRPLDDAIEQVLNEVEESTSGFSAVGLQLYSPCIRAIRLSSCEKHPPVFAQPCVTDGPHSGYANFSPLGSYPAKAPPGSPPFGSAFDNSTPEKPADPTLSALRAVFPYAPTPRLNSLHATYLALHYVSTISVPLPDNSPIMPKIVSKKAYKTLGLQPLTPVQTSFTRKTSEWTRERVEHLEVGLRVSLTHLVSEIVGKRGGKNDELLMKALSEVVRMGEGTCGDRGIDDMGGGEMGSGKMTRKSPSKVKWASPAKVSGKSPTVTPMKKKRSIRNFFEEL